MSDRARRIAIFLTLLVLLLFAGQWVAVLLTDRWWAAGISPRAAVFVTRYHLHRLGLEGARILLTCAWFTGNLLILYRAIGSVQVPRQIANLEIREALTPRVLVLTAVAIGTVAGFAIGSGGSGWWAPITLAWRGVTYREIEPLLGQDFGLYVAQLPLWRLLHGYALLLCLLALGGILMLYVLIGSVRWLDGRPAISDYARGHLGVLLALLALCLAWGYALEPYELVAGLHDRIESGLFDLQALIADGLVGVALATAALTALWSWRPRHALAAAAWTVLATASVIGHHVIPALGITPNQVAVETTDFRKMEGLAYGIPIFKDTLFRPGGGVTLLPAPAALWPESLAVRVAVPDSMRLLAANRAVLTLGGRPRPVWLVVRSTPNGRASVVALADDRVGATGSGLTYQEADTFAYPQTVTLLDLSPHAIRPGGPDFVIDTLGPGVRTGAWLRRLLLAWGLQGSDLLARLPPNARVSWNLSPASRLSLLAPYADWRSQIPRLIGGRLFWLMDGYISSRTFPLSSRTTWSGHLVGSVRAAFVGVVDAESGETRIYLRHTADALAEAWVAISDSLIQPASAMAPELGRAIPYPRELLRVQAKVLEGAPWWIGRLIGETDPVAEAAPDPDEQWEADTSRFRLQLVYEEPQDRRITAALRGGMSDGWESLDLMRFDSLGGMPSPELLRSKWNRFTTYEQLRDSIIGSGGRWVGGPLLYWLGSRGLGAYQTGIGVNQSGDPALAWVSLAIGEHYGAGRNLADASSNLRGLTIPLVSSGVGSSQLDEARHWLAAADSALRRGDMEAFGRAFEALRRVLQPGPVHHKS